MDYQLEYENWVANPLLNAEGLRELTAIKDDETQKEYRFGAELQFGTAGMRGIIGYGTNMMNVYTVRRATQGLADYISSLGDKAKARGVVISYDTRKNSKLFANAAAGVLAANGIYVYLFSDVRPVPVLSFAVRHLGATAGIMITASHNPKEYNGYKVYGEDGAQMSPEATQKVVDYISNYKDYFAISADEHETSPLGVVSRYVQMIGKGIDKKYYRAVCKQALSKDAVKKASKNLKLVYTPVHGSGFVPVTAVLSKLGIPVTVVQEQTVQDDNFSTVQIPNPECAETLSMGVALADKIGADVVIGTDPDCDRLGAAVRTAEGKFVCLSGNQTGILLLDYVLMRLKETKQLPKNGVVIKSFVSTGMAKSIADEYGVELVDVPVGFKFIGEKMTQYEKDGSKKFLFGFEESCGYLRGNHCRDKDAVVASMLFAEMACYHASKNRTVYQRLTEIYDKYGFVYDCGESIAFSGIHAMRDMKAVVNALREKKIENLDMYGVLATRNYIDGVRVTADGEITELDVEKNNCIYYEIENGSFICVRPSGTEPKLKIYYSIKALSEAKAMEAFAKLKAAFTAHLQV